MTRKHFNAIAKTLVRMQSDEGMTQKAYNVVCQHMGYQLAEFNPHFDFHKWNAAVKWAS